MVGSSTACSAAWTLGTILVIQSGSPSQIGNLTNPASDGYNTVNNNDAGVYFNGITARQLQSAVGVFHTGNPWVLTVNPNLIVPSGTAAPSLTPANIPGVWGYRPYLYGPHWFNDDLSLNKIVPIREHVHATFQAEFLNVTNQPTFNLGTLSVRSTAFGQQTATAAGSTPSVARRIELRANIGIVQARCRTVFLSTMKCGNMHGLDRITRNTAVKGFFGVFTISGFSALCVKDVHQFAGGRLVQREGRSTRHFSGSPNLTSRI